nr:fimbrillin family protein [Prevotella sp.]
MKIFSKLIICAYGLAALAACSSEKEENSQEHGVPMSLTTEITQTRSAITGTTFGNGDKIGVYTLNSGGTQYDTGSMNMQSAFNGTDWTFPTGSVYLKTANATVYAYYPYDATNTTTSVPINILPNDSTGQTDYLYGTASSVVNSTNPKAQITFKHALSMITLSITKTDGSTGAGLLTSVSLKNASAKIALSTKGSMDIISGTITPTADTYATLSADINQKMDVKTPVTTDFLFIPVKTAADLILTITVDGKMYDVALPSTDFKAGYKYVFPVTVSIYNSKMTVSSCAVTEWSSETASPMSITDNNTQQAKIGDYLFSDGTWGTLANNTGKTPIAVIFSNTTSTTDQGHGWTHGYAMALKNASTSAEWGPEETNPTGVTISTTASLIADKDGYTETTKINSSTYPAAYAAATTYKSIVAATGNTSGWYLPSIGQLYDICVNLGKCYYDEFLNLNWSDQSQNCTNNINSYLTPLTSGTYDIFPWSSSTSYAYWSSSETRTTSTKACYISFFSDGLSFYYSDKTYAFRVRSVIAF